MARRADVVMRACCVSRDLRRMGSRIQRGISQIRISAYGLVSDRSIRTCTTLVPPGGIRSIELSLIHPLIPVYGFVQPAHLFAGDDLRTVLFVARLEAQG